MNLLIRFIVNAIVLWLVISLVPGFHNDAGASGFGAYGVWTVVLLAIIFGLVNMLIGPILRLVSFPITWLTHGLFQVRHQLGSLRTGRVVYAQPQGRLAADPHRRRRAHAGRDAHRHDGRTQESGRVAAAPKEPNAGRHESRGPAFVL